MYLIEQLNKTVFPSEKLERFSFLIVKNREKDLLEEELNELTRLLKEDQNLHIERMKIILEIAQLKDVSVEKLSEDLRINSRNIF